MLTARTIYNLGEGGRSENCILNGRKATNDNLLVGRTLDEEQGQPMILFMEER